MINPIFGAVISPGGAIARTFARMQIAEEEIAAIGVAAGALPRRIFYGLRPTPVLAEFSDDLYRKHVRELIWRKGDLDLATDAEVLAGLMHQAMKAPLNRVGQAISEHLFSRLFPDRLVDEIEHGRALPLDAEEDLDRLRRRLGCKKRLEFA